MTCRFAIVALASTVLAAVGCDRSPTYPTELEPRDDGRPSDLVIKPERISDAALLELRVGDEFQLTACARDRDDDGKRVEDCTIDADWSSTNTRTVTVEDGLVRAVAAGFASVDAEYRGVSAAGILVKSGLGPGVPVWWLTGMVRDVETGRGLWGATVQVRDGIFAGVSDETGSTGTYRLRDVAGPLRIDVERRGYESASATIEMTGPRMLNVDLTPLGSTP